MHPRHMDSVPVRRTVPAVSGARDLAQSFTTQQAGH